ncbi:hypothetical protein V6N11_078200 [Hibiscus sabdariffa]|uniref:Uncharacterized protein n=1 Tax=Hibiscus sabdariffa TaxID=183260 RepID=A0ABR2TFC1_9ROSI
MLPSIRKAQLGFKQACVSVKQTACCVAVFCIASTKSDGSLERSTRLAQNKKSGAKGNASLLRLVASSAAAYLRSTQDLEERRGDEDEDEDEDEVARVDNLGGEEIFIDGRKVPLMLRLISIKISLAIGFRGRNAKYNTAAIFSIPYAKGDVSFLRFVPAAFSRSRQDLEERRGDEDEVARVDNLGGEEFIDGRKVPSELGFFPRF